MYNTGIYSAEATGVRLRPERGALQDSVLHMADLFGYYSNTFRIDACPGDFLCASAVFSQIFQYGVKNGKWRNGTAAGLFRSQIGRRFLSDCMPRNSFYVPVNETASS
jgi:hypothetical protein